MKQQQALSRLTPLLITDTMLDTGENEFGGQLPIPPEVMQLMGRFAEMEEVGGCYGFYALPNGHTVHVSFPPLDKGKGHKVQLMPPPIIPWHRSQAWSALITAAEVITSYLMPGELLPPPGTNHLRFGIIRTRLAGLQLSSVDWFSNEWHQKPLCRKVMRACLLCSNGQPTTFTNINPFLQC